MLLLLLPPVLWMLRRPLAAVSRWVWCAPLPRPRKLRSVEADECVATLGVPLCVLARDVPAPPGPDGAPAT
jgi:hypothetical protein